MNNQFEPDAGTGPGGGAPSEHRGQSPVLEVRQLCKAFGHIQALQEVDVQVFAGEVVALVGDNGAGKSTLIGCITGALQPDSGEIRIDGRPIPRHDPTTIREMGIETVYQALALAPDLEVATSMFLGREKLRPGLLGRLGFIDRTAMRREADLALKQLAVSIPAISNPVSTLSGGQRQAVAIARAVKWGRRLILLDEPTAALGVSQAKIVLETVRRVSAAGTPVVWIGHNLAHVFEVSDRIVVLRLGRVVANAKRCDVSADEVVGFITGGRTQ